MYKRYYDGYGMNPIHENKGEVIIPKESTDENEADVICQNSDPESFTDTQNSNDASASIARHLPRSNGKNFLSGIELDDIILIGVIILVLKDNPDDPMLILILAAIFLLGVFE